MNIADLVSQAKATWNGLSTNGKLATAAVGGACILVLLFKAAGQGGTNDLPTCANSKSEIIKTMTGSPRGKASGLQVFDIVDINDDFQGTEKSFFRSLRTRLINDRVSREPKFEESPPPDDPQQRQQQKEMTARITELSGQISGIDGRKYSTEQLWNTEDVKAAATTPNHLLPPQLDPQLAEQRHQQEEDWARRRQKLVDETSSINDQLNQQNQARAQMVKKYQDDLARFSANARALEEQDSKEVDADIAKNHDRYERQYREAALKDYRVGKFTMSCTATALTNAGRAAIVVTENLENGRPYMAVVW